MRSYLAQVVGPDRAAGAAERALAELRGLGNGSGPREPDVGAVREAARAVSLAELDAEAQGIGRRITRAVTGRLQCTALARRLRDRASGQISGDELRAFYEHVGRCQACAEIARRFDAGEWYLQVELGSAKPSGAAEVPPGREHGPPSTGLRPAGWRPSGRVIVAVVSILVVGIVAAFVTQRAPKRSATPASRPASKAATVVTPSIETPFVVAGARFHVFEDAHQRWTTFAKTATAGAGKRWVLVTVVVRNLTRVGFDPRVLHYRLTSAGGVNYFPSLLYGTGSAVHMPANPLAIGALTQVELAFDVPSATSGLQLAFDPSSGQHERVLVSLRQ